MTTSKERIWESVEAIDGNFLGFVYQIRKITGYMWRIDAIFPKGPIHITGVAGSPGEALEKMANDCLAKSPVR